MLSTFRVYASSQVYVEYFYLPGCPDCEKTNPIIEKIESEYGDKIVVDWVDVSVREGWERWKQYNFTEVPAVVVNREYRVPKDEISYEKLKEVIDMYLYGERPKESLESLGGISLLLPFSLGLFSGFSPCLMAILSFILAYSVTKQNIKENWLLCLGNILARLGAIAATYEILAACPLCAQVVTCIPACTTIFSVWWCIGCIAAGFIGCLICAGGIAGLAISCYEAGRCLGIW